MATKTPKLGLNIWLESDPVNFEEVNENFKKIDDMVMCIESGEVSSSYSGGVSGSTTWKYKKYSDGTIDMSTKMEFTNIKCNGGSSAPYYSGTLNLYLPFTLSQVYDVQMHLASNTIGWVSDITGQSVLDKVTFRLLAMENESDYKYKQVFINVKGVLA